MKFILKQILHILHILGKNTKTYRSCFSCNSIKLQSSFSTFCGCFSTAAPLSLKGLMRGTTNTEGLKLGIQEVQYIIWQTSYSEIKTSPRFTAQTTEESSQANKLCRHASHSLHDIIRYLRLLNISNIKKIIADTFYVYPKLDFKRMKEMDQPSRWKFQFFENTTYNKFARHFENH